MTRPSFRRCAAVAALLLAPLALAQPIEPAQPAEAPPDDPGSIVANPLTSRRFDNALQLLDALEEAGRRIRSLAAGIQYTRLFGIAGDTQVRKGAVLYHTDNRPGQPPLRRFAIDFHSLTVGDRHERDYGQRYIFDGEWLIEIIPDEKQFTKRQIVPPGESFDPLKIGEGPFPMPIGQTKADILERFTAELAPPLEGLENEQQGLRAFANRLVQLKLTPILGRPEADEFRVVRVWYDPASEHLIPWVAKTVSRDFDESLVVLFDPDVNVPIELNRFATEPPPADEGWKISVEPFRRAAPNTRAARPGESP